MRTTTVFPLSAALLVLLAGCSATSGSSVDAGGAEPVPYAESQESEAASEDASGDADSSAPSVDAVEQSIIVTASVRLVDDDPVQAASDVADLADAHGGFVADRQEGAGGDDADAWSTITVRVPADDLDAVMDALADVGEVRDTSMSQVDVTQQVRDLDVRIESLQASIDRLTELLASADDTATLLEVEEQLTQRTSELESLLAEQAHLDDQVSMSTLTVDIAVPSASPDAPETFLDGLVAGWHGLVAFATGLAVVAGALLPWLAVLGLVVLLVWVLVRRRIRARRAQRRSAGRRPSTDEAPRVANPVGAAREQIDAYEPDPQA